MKSLFTLLATTAVAAAATGSGRGPTLQVLQKLEAIRSR